MKLKQITLACAVALAVPMAAHAAPASGPFDTAGAMTVYLSGASAPDTFLDSVILALLKSTPASPTFKYTAGTDYRAYLGETLGGQKIFFIKRSKGGSVFGVNPLGDLNPANRKLQTMIIRAPGDAAGTSSVCTTALPNVTSGAGVGTCNTGLLNPAIVGNDPGFGTPSIADQQPDFGVSDVAPFMFKGAGLGTNINVEFGANELPSPNGLVPQAVNTLMMGIVTTASVPDSLYISNADYHGMLTAGILDWSTLGLVPTSPTDLKTGVVVCRRWAGSGTQASYNWYFNQFPCTKNSATSGVSGDTDPFRMVNSPGWNAAGSGDGLSVGNPILIDVTGGYTVIEGSGSGDVRKCLNAAQAGLSYDFKSDDGKFVRANFNANPVGNENVLGKYRAIGVLSLDSQSKTSTTVGSDGGSESNWFFRPLNGTGRFYSNTTTTPPQTCLVGATLATPGGVPMGGTMGKGVCPNRTELRSGHYDFAAELTMQSTIAPLTDIFAITRAAFIADFITAAAAPANQALWTMSVPSIANPPDGINAVAFFNRSTLAGQCGPLIRFQ